MSRCWLSRTRCCCRAPRQAWRRPVLMAAGPWQRGGVARRRNSLPLTPPLLPPPSPHSAAAGVSRSWLMPATLRVRPDAPPPTHTPPPAVLAGTGLGFRSALSGSGQQQQWCNCKPEGAVAVSIHTFTHSLTLCVAMLPLAACAQPLCVFVGWLHVQNSGRALWLLGWMRRSRSCM